jgi:hypothetical protein
MTWWKGNFLIITMDQGHLNLFFASRRNFFLTKLTDSDTLLMVCCGLHLGALNRAAHAFALSKRGAIAA